MMNQIFSQPKRGIAGMSLTKSSLAEICIHIELKIVEIERGVTCLLSRFKEKALSIGMRNTLSR
jgi:hypothetical protein